MLYTALGLQLISNILLLTGVVVAIFTIIYNVNTAKKTQTARFLFESRTDCQYSESLHRLKKAHHSGKSFRSYVIAGASGLVTAEQQDERRKFQYILNFYERVAVSVKKGIYDEEMIKRTSYSTIIETWDIAEPFIKAVRESVHSQTIWQEYEWLVKRWKGRPLVIQSK